MLTPVQLSVNSNPRWTIWRQSPRLPPSTTAARLVDPFAFTPPCLILNEATSHADGYCDGNRSHD